MIYSVGFIGFVEDKEFRDLGLLKHGSGRVNCKWVGRLVGYVNMLKF